MFDLGDCVRWEFMFPSNEKPILEIPDMDDDGLDAFDEDEVNTSYFCKPCTQLWYNWSGHKSNQLDISCCISHCHVM